MSEEHRNSLSEKTGPIILKALKQYLKEIKGSLSEDVQVPPELLMNVDGSAVSHADAINQWVNVIERIIYAFNDNISIDDFGDIWEEDNEGKIVISNKAKFKKFERAQQEHEAKVRLGMKLFAKHYEFL